MHHLKQTSELEAELLLLKTRTNTPCISIKTIVETLSGKGRFLILLILSLPFCQPLQIPGVSTPFGLAIAFIGFRVGFGKRIWLPKAILSKTLSTKYLSKIIDKALLILHKIDPWIHPRLSAISQSRWMQTINGSLIIILGIFLALPLPIPLSNLAAAWAIFLITLGILSSDGVVILIGYSLFLLICAFFGITAFTLHSLFT